MAGLALGSYLGGRWIDRRKNALIFYAAIEGAIGFYCLLVTSLIESAWRRQEGAGNRPGHRLPPEQ